MGPEAESRVNNAETAAKIVDTDEGIPAAHRNLPFILMQFLANGVQKR
jgi:hypothetical protein